MRRLVSASMSSSMTCSVKSCPFLTLQAAGTSTCSSMKRRLPASRTRTAWKSIVPAWRWRARTSSTARSTSVDGAMSMRPPTESRMSVKPAHMMLSPAPRATTASSTAEPKTATSATPTRTAAEVTTSVARCLASATRVMERSRRPAR